MKVNLNLNLDEAILLLNILNKVDNDFIYSRIHKYEMENMSISNIKIAIKKIIKSLNNFDKSFDILLKDAEQLMEWLGIQTDEDTKELFTNFSEMIIEKYDRVLTNLYVDLSLSIEQYKLHK